jgi:hypothetical protein
MTVLFDFLSKRISPLQHRACPAWLYTKENGTTRLEHGRGSDLDPRAVDTMLTKLSPDLISPGFIIPPTICTPICLDQVAQLRLLKELTTLNNIDIAP